MKEDNAAKFTCIQCGEHDLIVTHVWNILAGDRSERWQEWGPLFDNHHWIYEYKEKVEVNPDDEAQLGDKGEFLENDSMSEPEEYEIHEFETNRENDEIFVNCGNCDREIEFGWSQPDRRGLIWPVDFSDFGPLECWPDPKYSDIWQRNGWLHGE